MKDRLNFLQRFAKHKCLLLQGGFEIGDVEIEKTGKLTSDKWSQGVNPPWFPITSWQFDYTHFNPA